MRIAFWGNFGTGNLGNECTLQAILHDARRRLPGAELICICTLPEDVEARHGIAAVPISDTRLGTVRPAPARRATGLRRRLRRLRLEVHDWRHALSTMRRTDMLVMCGTGMLSDAGEGAGALPYELLRWSLAARLCGRRLLFLGVGAESIRGTLARALIKAALRLAQRRCYRDRPSRDYLQRLGVDVQDDAVCPDLAFSLPAHLFPLASAARSPFAVVGVGLYDYRGRGAAGGRDAEAYRDYLDKLGGFVSWLLRRNLDVRIILGDLRYDEPVRRDLAAWLAEHGVAPPPGRYQDEPAPSVERLIEQLGAVDVLVATRFHGVLLALMLAKPVVSVSYNEKNDALMAEMGLARYCQTVEAFRLDRLIEQFLELERNAATHGARLHETSRQYRRQLEELYAQVFPSGPLGQPAP